MEKYQDRYSTRKKEQRCPEEEEEEEGWWGWRKRKVRKRKRRAAGVPGGCTLKERTMAKPFLAVSLFLSSNICRNGPYPLANRRPFSDDNKRRDPPSSPFPFVFVRDPCMYYVCVCVCVCIHTYICALRRELVNSWDNLEILQIE